MLNSKQIYGKGIIYININYTFQHFINMSRARRGFYLCSSIMLSKSKLKLERKIKVYFKN